MTITRSQKLRQSSMKKGKRGGKGYVTYRGLLHGAMTNLSRRERYGARPIPQEVYYDEIRELAASAKKKLPTRRDWMRAYCSTHIQAGINDDYFHEHGNGALSVTPKARFRYRAVQRRARKTGFVTDLETADFCRALEKELGPSSLKSKAELLVDNRALIARLNRMVPRTPPRTDYQPWSPLSPLTDREEDEKAEGMIDTLESPPSPIAGPNRIAYPSPESLPRASASRNAFSPVEPSTPCPPRSATLSPTSLMSRGEPELVLIEGQYEFTAVRDAPDSDDSADRLTLNVPGPCSLTLKFSAASLERNIVKLEQDLRNRDEAIDELKAEVDCLIAERENLQRFVDSGTIERKHAVSSLNAVIEARSERILALEAECLLERTQKDRALEQLKELQQVCDRLSDTLQQRAQEAAVLLQEKDGLAARIAELEHIIEKTREEHAEAQRELKEEYEVQLQLLRTQIAEHKAVTEKLRAHATAIVELTSHLSL